MPALRSAEKLRMGSSDRPSIPLRFLQVLVGLMCGIGAISLGLIPGICVYHAPTSLDTYLSPLFWIPAPLAVLLGISTYRLVAGRGASAGSRLSSPAGYRAFGGLMLFLCVLVVGGMAPHELVRSLWFGAFFLAFSIACFATARKRALLIDSCPDSLGALQ
jgi:hypothetical protein